MPANWPDEKAIEAAVKGMREIALHQDWSPRKAAVAGLRAAVAASPVIPAPRCETCGGGGRATGETRPAFDAEPWIACPDCHGSGVERVIPERAIREWVARCRESWSNEDLCHCVLDALAALLDTLGGKE